MKEKPYTPQAGWFPLLVVIGLVVAAPIGFLFGCVIADQWSAFVGAVLIIMGVLAGLTALFWIGLAVVFGLRSRSYMAGAIGVVLVAIIVFFIGGGLSLVRYNREHVRWYTWIFPNAHAVDPIRDMVLFETWPEDWTITLLKLVGFAALSLVVGMTITSRRLRRLG